jgi:hypothetical protein
MRQWVSGMGERIGIIVIGRSLTSVKIFCAPAASKNFPRRNPTTSFKGRG